MNKLLFVSIISVLLVAGCSDKDEPATVKTEPGMLERMKESTSNAMTDMKDAAGNAMEKTGEMASDTADAVGDAARDIKESASDMATSAAGAVTAAAGDAKDKAGEMVADATEAVAEMSDDMDDGGAVGQQVYQRSCQSCHAMGVAGSPKLADKAAWAPRIALGMDALVASVIKGKGIMPPRGACASCSDGDIKAAVQYMVSQSR